MVFRRRRKVVLKSKSKDSKIKKNEPPNLLQLIQAIVTDEHFYGGIASRRWPATRYQKRIAQRRRV